MFNCSLLFYIIDDRIRAFILAVITDSSASPIRLAAGIGVIQSELAALTSQFLRLVAHNREAFMPIYSDIIDRFSSTYV